MRLTAGAFRELHWHMAGEWAIMLYGNARITAIDLDGKSFVADVGKDDLWFFPSGIPHSIQGLNPDGCEFMLVFDDGNFSESETVLLSDAMAPELGEASLGRAILIVGSVSCVWSALHFWLAGRRLREDFAKA